MKLQDHLKWNPLVPIALIGIMFIRSQVRGFPFYGIVCMAGVAVWLAFCVYRTLYRKSKRATTFPPLSDAELEKAIGRLRMDHFLPRRFGFVWISDMITKYGYPVGMMFRDEPKDKTFSGWTFVSGQEDDWRYGSHIDLHDAQAILRCDPSFEKYLDMPPGTVLSRQPDGTFAADKEDADRDRDAP